MKNLKNTITLVALFAFLFNYANNNLISKKEYISVLINHSNITPTPKAPVSLADAFGAFVGGAAGATISGGFLTVVGAAVGAAYFSSEAEGERAAIIPWPPKPGPGDYNPFPSDVKNMNNDNDVVGDLHNQILSDYYKNKQNRGDLLNYIKSRRDYYFGKLNGYNKITDKQFDLLLNKIRKEYVKYQAHIKDNNFLLNEITKKLPKNVNKKDFISNVNDFLNNKDLKSIKTFENQIIQKSNKSHGDGFTWNDLKFFFSVLRYSIY